MSRKYEGWVSESVRTHLTLLLQAADDGATLAYGEMMHTLGKDLGNELRRLLPTTGEILLVTTVEHADFLARGLLDALSLGPRAKVFCYWNERDADQDIAPIRSRYEEPLASVSAIIVVKSIISGACVVRTNLIEALEKLDHEVPLFVVAPVTHVDSANKLRAEFPADVANRFRFVAATDTEKDGDIIRPGIGGSVYELLGLGDKLQKNRHEPRLITDRSALFE